MFDVIQKAMTVRLDKGLEARPVAVFVQIASQYESTVHVEVDGKRINAKSIMGMMSLGIVQGEEITIAAEGSDAEAAVDELAQYLQNAK